MSRLRLPCSLAELTSIARTELLYLACFASLYFRTLLGLLGVLCFGYFARTARGLLAREADFARTNYAWFARFVYSALGSLASLVQTELDLTRHLFGSLSLHDLAGVSRSLTA